MEIPEKQINEQQALPVDELINTVIDSYRIESLIHRGPYASVYRVRHGLLDKYAALKILHAGASADAVERLKREALNLSQNDSPFIVKVLSCGRLENAQAYLLTEYMEGGDLKEALAEKGRLDARSFQNIFKQVAAALVQAHELSIVHRDLKPSNILLSEKDLAQTQAKVADFGLSVDEQQSTQALTRTGKIMGTPMYMSPEQCRGEKVDAASDIYSLGLIMYEALNGSPPFQADSGLAIMSMHLNQIPAELASGLPPALDRLIMSCIEKDKSKRPLSAAQVLAELEQIPASHWDEMGRKSSKHGSGSQRKHLAALLLACFLASAAFLFVSMHNDYLLEFGLNALSSGLSREEKYRRFKSYYLALKDHLPPEQEIHLCKLKLNLARDLYGLKSSKAKKLGNVSLMEDEPKATYKPSFEEYLQSLSDYQSINPEDKRTGYELGQALLFKASQSREAQSAAQAYLKSFELLNQYGPKNRTALLLAYQGYVDKLLAAEKFEEALHAIPLILPPSISTVAKIADYEKEASAFAQKWGVPVDKQPVQRAVLLSQLSESAGACGKNSLALSCLSEASEIWKADGDYERQHGCRAKAASIIADESPSRGLKAYEQILRDLGKENIKLLKYSCELKKEAASCCFVLADEKRGIALLKEGIADYQETLQTADLYKSPAALVRVQEKVAEAYLLLLDHLSNSTEFSAYLEQLKNGFSSLIEQSSSLKARIKLAQARHAFNAQDYGLAEAMATDSINLLSPAPGLGLARVEQQKLKQSLELLGDVYLKTNRPLKAQASYLKAMELVLDGKSIASLYTKLGLIEFKHFHNRKAASRYWAKLYTLCSKKNLPIYASTAYCLNHYAGMEESEGSKELAAQIRAFVSKSPIKDEKPAPKQGSASVPGK